MKSNFENCELAIEAQLQAGPSFPNGAVISWIRHGEKNQVLSRYEDRYWIGAPIGSLASMPIGGRRIDFERFSPPNRARARQTMYCYLRHPQHISRAPSFTSLIKRMVALNNYFSFLEARGLSVNDVVVETTHEYLLQRTKEFEHIESITTAIATLRDVQVYFDLGYLDYTIPFFKTNKGAKAIAKRYWLEVHGKDFDGTGYQSYTDEDITLIMRNADFYTNELAPHIIPIARECLEITSQYPDRRKSKREESACYKKLRKFISKSSFPHTAAGILQWPPNNFKQLMLHVRMCSAASAITFCFGLGGRISELLSLRDGSLHRTTDGQALLDITYFKGEDSTNGRVVSIPVADDVVRAIRIQVEVKKLMRQISHGFLTPRAETDFLFVQTGTRHFIDIDTHQKEGAHAMLDEPFSIEGSRISNQGMTGMLRDFKKFVVPEVDGALASHRFRKTVARLVTLTMEGAPLILQLLYGHDSYRTTLGYMFSSPFVQDELAVSYPALIASNLKKLYAGRADLLGGGARPLREALAEFGQSRSAVLTETEIDMTESEFVELGLQMMTDGHMVLSVLGEGRYCLKPLQSRGPCNESPKELLPNVGRCAPSCRHHLIVGSERNKLVSIVQWLERKLSDEALSQPLRRFYGGYQAELSQVLAKD